MTRNGRNSKWTLLSAVLAAVVLFARSSAGQTYDEEVSGVQSPKPEDDPDRLRGADLARELPGAEIAPGLPPFAVMPALHMHIPYQFGGFGLTLEAVPVKWLRLSALYSFGISPTKNEIAWTSYAEALAGVRLFGISSESAVDIKLKKRGAGLNPKVPIVKAWLPSYHALFVEAGGMMGFTSLEVCSDDCVDADGNPVPSDDGYLVMPMAGIRYVFAYDARSVRRNVRARALVQVYAHLIGKPFNTSEAPRYFPSGTSAGKQGFGGRAGVAIPPLWTCLAEITLGIGCLDGNIALGYAPYPRILILELQVGSYIY
jgi:hypothetical protein